MWEEAYLVNSWVQVFFMGSKKIIVIWPMNHLRKGTCTAHIFGNGYNQHATIHEKDKDILKIKAILKAKELGWDIKKVTP